MLTGSLIKGMMEPESGMVNLPLSAIIEILGHSILLGFTLGCATFLIGRHLDKTAALATVSPPDVTKDIIGAMNLMFLTVGLCALMILINNSLLRAFAIVAAISVVRFRVKLDSKALGSAMIFAILAGMACGVRELQIAYVSVGVFLVLVSILILLIKLTEQPAAKPVIASVENIQSLQSLAEANAAHSQTN
jgi:hypothetical protein